MEFESDPRCRLYVGNLSFSITEEDVKNMFSTAGTVNDVYLPRIFKTPKHKGFGFVEMASFEDALKAISQLHDTPDMYGRNMVVRFADLRRSKEEQMERRKKFLERKKKHYTQDQHEEA
ncbi:MAG: RNA-binding protein [Clostridiaceae bacterium]